MSTLIIQFLFACNTDTETDPSVTNHDYDRDGYTEEQGDCNDESSSVSPGATEVCDGIDQDCDGDIDEGVVLQFYTDADGDGFGNDVSIGEACVVPENSVEIGGDCDDENSDIHPDAFEICDEIDNDCDQEIDEELILQTWYLDQDSDGYGVEEDTVESCSPVENYAEEFGDCDDSNAEIYPGAPEICDGLDNDCDALIDDDDDEVVDQILWSTDSDGDGFGAESSQLLACFQPENMVEDAQDCDDENADIHPDAYEICGDGVDNNCDSDLTAPNCSLSLGDAEGILRGNSDSFFGKEVDYLGALTGGNPLVGISANRDDTGALDAGALYLFDVTNLSGSLTTSDAVASIHSTEQEALFGVMVAGEAPFGTMSSSDVNSDGIPDFAVGATKADNGGDENNGKVYLFHGGFSGNLDAEADAAAILVGEAAGDEAGYALDFGDINNDGVADLLIGAIYNDQNADKSGAAYLVYGPISSGSLADADVKIYGADLLDHLGNAVLNSGDINGDGVDDMIISAYRDDPLTPGSGQEIGDAGMVYVYYGGFSGSPTTEDADIVLKGEEVGAYIGRDIFRGGDVNGDGFEDVLIGARNHPTDSQNTNGSAFLISGGSNLSPEIWMGDATARMDGENHLDEFSRSALGLGDINGDGFGDLAIGAKGADNGGEDSGAVYLYYGPLTGVYGVGDYHGVLTGELAGDNAGISMTSLGDVNSSGVSDIMVGGYWNSSNGNQAGAAYFILGEDLIP